MALGRFTRVRPAPRSSTMPAPPPTAVSAGTMPASDIAPATAELLAPAQAADLLGVRAQVLERWRGTGDGPAFVRLSSKTIRYRRQDIAAFVAERVRSSTAQG